MIRLNGREVADEILEDLRKRIEVLKSKGITPRLAILRVGQREDDLAYERGLLKRFEVTGSEADVNVLDEKVSQAELDSTFDRLNKYFTISSMPVAPSQYWSAAHGRSQGEVTEDEEGMQIMRTLARNMSFMIKAFKTISGLRKPDITTAFLSSSRMFMILSVV